MREHSRAARQQGFSMIELMIAMVVTLIISASIVGLITQSNTAFKIQPELGDRQQNIRVAMDVIQRDLQGAGVNMALNIPVFKAQNPNAKATCGCGTSFTV